MPSGLRTVLRKGCTSAAATTDEVLRRATEAVRLWAKDALADGEKLPKPRSVEAPRTDPEVAAALEEAPRLQSYRSSSIRANRLKQIFRSTRASRQHDAIWFLSRNYSSMPSHFMSCTQQSDPNQAT